MVRGTVRSSLRFPAVALLVAAPLALSTAACATGSTPRARVARDLGCTQDVTSVVRVPDATPPGPGLGRWQVTGCGRTAVYVCTEPVRDCWREGEVQPLARLP